jgi:hypothetical protein
VPGRPRPRGACSGRSRRPGPRARRASRSATRRPPSARLPAAHGRGTRRSGTAAARRRRGAAARSRRPETLQELGAISAHAVHGQTPESFGPAGRSSCQRIRRSAPRRRGNWRARRVHVAGGVSGDCFPAAQRTYAAPAPASPTGSVTAARTSSDVGMSDAAARGGLRPLRAKRLDDDRLWTRCRRIAAHRPGARALQLDVEAAPPACRPTNSSNVGMAPSRVESPGSGKRERGDPRRPRRSSRRPGSRG